MIRIESAGNGENVARHIRNRIYKRNKSRINHRENRVFVVGLVTLLSAGSTSCMVGSKAYSEGQSIIFHNSTFPVEEASCTHCECKDGAVENCVFSYCDLGLHHGTTLQLCDQWLTEQNGECCPICGEKTLRNRVIRSSGDC